MLDRLRSVRITITCASDEGKWNELNVGDAEEDSIDHVFVSNHYYTETLAIASLFGEEIELTKVKSIPQMLESALARIDQKRRRVATEK